MEHSKIDIRTATPAITCNLFDRLDGFRGVNGKGGTNGKGKTLPARKAESAEILAYGDFLRRRENMPEIGEAIPVMRSIGRGRSQHSYCVGVTYGGNRDCGYDDGAFSVLFPGANRMQPQVTFEEVDDSGEVVASSTMPIEPKKGGVVWTLKDVRAAHGPKGTEIPGTPTASIDAQPEPVADTPTGEIDAAAPEYAPPKRVRTSERIVGNLQYGSLQQEHFVIGQAGGFDATTCEDLTRWHWQREGRTTAYGEGYETQEQALAALDAYLREYNTAETTPEQPQERETDIPAPSQPETTETAPSAPEIAAEPVSEPASDPIAGIMARLDALEAALASPLPAESVDTPTGAIKPKRAPAHERAIRRAWAERKARREAERGCAAFRDMAETTEIEYQSVKRELATLRPQYDNAAKARTDFLRGMKEACERERIEHIKRRRSTTLARDLQKRLNAEHRLVDRANERRLEAEKSRDMTQAELAEIKRELEDAKRSPMMMTGEGQEQVDLIGRQAHYARTAIERAERAETANAALQQRCERVEAANQQGAAAIEEIVSRMTKAEARLRQLDKAA